jgi:molecular chaperone HtpG
MAEILSRFEQRQLEPVIGRQVLDIITSGMYDDPLMVYREYIQNAVDSIDLGIEKQILDSDEGEISIDISGFNRSVRIQDNGIGIPNSEAKAVLINLGSSPKEGLNLRGFRGIGRLGGLAYCDLLRFETRSGAQEEVAVVEWYKKYLDEQLKGARGEATLIEAIKKVARGYLRPPQKEDPKHFLRVEMTNVQKFHSDSLMDIERVGEYLSQVAPVSYNPSKFSFANKLNEHFSRIKDFRTYEIYLNGEQVFRPYEDGVTISNDRKDRIKDVECFEFLDNKGSSLALGWYAKTNFMASLPSQVSMRGIRVRQGNMEIGDEYFLADMYTERRFATWNIGEIHIWNHNLKPNSRRDGFEQTENYERFLEQANALGKHLSTLCRKHSLERSLNIRLECEIKSLERMVNNLKFVIDREHLESIKTKVEDSLQRIKPLIERSNGEGELRRRLQAIIKKSEKIGRSAKYLGDSLDGRTVRHIPKKELMRKVCRAVLDEYQGSKSAYELVDKILYSFLKPMKRNN